MNRAYKEQVALLLSVLPEIAKEECFALHGGTAINLFLRDMPRLSVDVDLTYLPIEDRLISLDKITKALERIEKRVRSVLKGVKVQHQIETCKLLISNKGSQIKVEVNLMNRGSLSDPVQSALCKKAQEEFDAFCSISTIPHSQLYGGKICAALDRQHPRDLFDVKYLLDNEGITDEVKQGLLFCLLSSSRPMNELLQPNFQDQRVVFDNQFNGMTDESFTYEDYETTREKLVSKILGSLTASDKQFLVGFSSLTPDWSIYGFERFPSIQWKIQNLSHLKEKNPGKFDNYHELLKVLLAKA